MAKSPVDLMLDGAKILQEYRPFLKEAITVAIQNSAVTDLPFIVPLLMRVYILEKENIKFSPKEFYDLIRSNIEPLLPALRLIPMHPIGITAFDPLSALLGEIEKNIIALMKLSFKINWYF